MLKKHVSSTAVAAAGMFVLRQVWPPTDVNSWFGVIMGVVLLVIAVFVWRNETELTAKAIAFELSGGNNFCYLCLYSIVGKPHQPIIGQYQLQMVAVGGPIEKMNSWISPWGLEPTGAHGDPYYSLDIRKPLVEIVHAGGRAWDKALPVGDYRIDFSARNGNWYERLRIYELGGEIKHSVRVTTRLTGGDVLYDSEASPKKQSFWSRFRKLLNPDTPYSSTPGA